MCFCNPSLKLRFQAVENDERILYTSMLTAFPHLSVMK